MLIRKIKKWKLRTGGWKSQSTEDKNHHEYGALLYPCDHCCHVQYTLPVVLPLHLPSVSTSRMQLKNAGTPALWLTTKGTRKGAMIKSSCHTRRTKSTGIVDFPRSIPVGKEWQNVCFSHSLGMVPFSGGFTNAGVARLWTRPMMDREARLSSICWIRIKIYTRTSTNKWWRSKVWWGLPWWCGCNVERTAWGHQRTSSASYQFLQRRQVA